MKDMPLRQVHKSYGRLWFYPVATRRSLCRTTVVWHLVVTPARHAAELTLEAFGRALSGVLEGTPTTVVAA